MTDINKLIEKACTDYCEKVDSVYNEKDVFKAGANFVLHQNRWRKVEEELPEWKGEVYQILIRLHSKPLSVTGWTINNEFSLDPIKNMGGVEWKPIE